MEADKEDNLGMRCRFCKLPYAIMQNKPSCKCTLVPATRHDVYMLMEKLDQIISLTGQGANR